MNIVIKCLILIVFFIGCRESLLKSDPIEEVGNKWVEVTFFSNADIRDIEIKDGIMYISAVVGHFGIPDSSFIFYSSDGVNWDTLMFFEREIGPIEFIGDSLIVLETGRIWNFHKANGWNILYNTLIDARNTYDMFFLNKELFVFQIGQDFSFSTDSARPLKNTPVESKFVKGRFEGNEVAYTMPYYAFIGPPYRFDGNNFTKMNDGILTSENLHPNFPSINVHENILYAGFNSPVRIKKYQNNAWINVTDSLNTFIDSHQTPTIINSLSSITFVDNRMFVGTQNLGVWEWGVNGWESRSDGLQKQYSDQLGIAYFNPIIFLSFFGGSLFVGYGEPGFAPIYQGRGLYKLKIN